MQGCANAPVHDKGATRKHILYLLKKGTFSGFESGHMLRPYSNPKVFFYQGSIVQGSVIDVRQQLLIAPTFS